MALVQATLEAAILDALDKQAAKQTEGDDPAVSRSEIAADLAQAIFDFVSSAQVNVTAFTATAGPYPVAGTATGNLT